LKVGQLLAYADVYEQPERFIDAYPTDSLTLKDISQDLDEMFRKITSFKGLLVSAVNTGEQAKLQA
jgi:hypothetical protein